MKRVGIVLLGLLFLLVLFILVFVFPRGKKSLEPLSHDHPNSIFEKIKIEVNGHNLGMILKGEDLSNPVLLFLSGGPGIPEYLLEYTHPTALYKHFTVCYFSYLGTGLSYAPNLKSEDMTSASYLEDVHCLTQYLKERFGQEKIYLLGHSFGTYIGLKAASVNPEDYYCYIGMSQICDQKKSEILGIERMVALYEQMDKNNKAEQLLKYDLNSEDSFQQYLQSPLRDQAMHELGVGTTRKMKSVISDIFLASLRMLDFTRQERLEIWKGKFEYNTAPVIEDAFNFNAFEQITHLEIPFFIFAGEHDFTCNYDLQKEYYQFLKAPQKEFYSFSESAHSPLFEEKEKSLDILIELKHSFTP